MPGSVGVVGFLKGKLVCFQCPQIKECCHLKFVKAAKDSEQERDRWPAIADLFMNEEATKERPDHKSRCRSVRKIPFIGNPDYMVHVISPPQSYMKKNHDGNALLFAPSVCSSCNSELEGEDYIAKEAVNVISEYRLEKGIG